MKHSKNGLKGSKAYATPDLPESLSIESVESPVTGAIGQETVTKTSSKLFNGAQMQDPAFDLVCLSHLRWNFVFQRPQHLLTRFARERRVFYVEEPIIDDGPTRLSVQEASGGVLVVVPYLDRKLNHEESIAAHRSLIDRLTVDYQVKDYILWYYTPMAMNYTSQLRPRLIVYDCMDDLTAFKNPPPRMKEHEAELMKRADLVFTGGKSLYESRLNTHPSIHLFPSSIDRAHFAKALEPIQEPIDQAGIPHPRLGFFGVIDERMDQDLIARIADARPDWHIMMIGPIAKVDPLKLPRRPNIHYLGIKPYSDLPAYLAGWDVALLPFALNEYTRFISPTKTPEYLAGGRPVVSTPIRDVVSPYGEEKLVWIAGNAGEFVQAIEDALSVRPPLDGRPASPARQMWLQRVDNFLAQLSWDRTWSEMRSLIENALGREGEDIPFRIDTSEDYISSNSSATLSSAHNPGLPVESVPRSVSRYQPNDSKKIFDYLIVGAGFAGSVLAERLACGSGKTVLIIDRRNHIGGNAYDHYDDAGLLVHKYGPHIFHTNSREVFAYLSRFTQWRKYEHRVRASVDGHLLPMPINLDTINQLYGMNLTSFELAKFFESVAEVRPSIRTSEDVVVSKVGRELYEKFFRNYTRKQWDLDPSELDASVTARVPIRLNRDDRYFNDTFQSMPLHGYTRMFENMLDHAKIKIMLNTDYRDILDFVSFRELIFTGPVDEYFDYHYGRLPYRSLEFKFETLDEEWHQPVAVVNYPNEHLFTRVTEFKHLTGQDHHKTSLVYEFPCAEGDPYYPIPRQENAELYKKYKSLADATPGVYFAGRLGTYKYYNMDQVTAQALSLYSKITGIERSKSIHAYSSGRFAIEMPGSLLGNVEKE